MSASTEALLTAARTRLLTFSPTTGTALSTALTGGLWVAQAPADVTYPYGLLRLMNRIQTEGYGGFRETGDLELVLLHKGREHEYDVEAMLDVADQAMLNWWDVTTGATWAGHRLRDMLPPAPAPMDRNVVQARWVCPYRCWLEYLTQYL